MSKELRWGFTTGTCAAAASKAAAKLLCKGETCSSVSIRLPDGEVVAFPVLETRSNGIRCEAAVRKNAGDDPDVTDGLPVWAAVSFSDGDGVSFSAGAGVGTVTLPGMQLSPGEPAINPGPRRMIVDAVREVSSRGMHVEISIPGGEEAAKRTFNGKLGIQGGLSILGTSGRVRPYSHAALRDALVCSLDIAKGCGITAPVMVPGNYGKRVALGKFNRTEREVIEVSNEWGFMLDAFTRRGFQALLVLGHPGKLVKLAMGYWNTHSRQSPGVVPYLVRCADSLGIPVAEDIPAAEGVFASLPTIPRMRLGEMCAGRVRRAVAGRVSAHIECAVVLTRMSGDIIGASGDITPWEGDRKA